VQELATLDPVTKAPPQSRIGDGANASAIVFKLLDADLLRASKRAKIKGMYDGNAPYNREEMKAKGMQTNCNLNFRQAPSIINQVKTPYYDLVVEVSLLADIQTSFGKATERADWSQIISEEYHRLLTDWDDWDDMIQKHQFQMLLNGPAVCFFHDEIDWRPDVAGAGEVLVPDETSTRLDELETIAILKNYPAHKLYRYIKNPEQAAILGWNVKAVEQAIIDSRNTSGEPPTSAQQLEWLQMKFKNADIYYGTYECTPIRTAHILVNEFDGRVSHHIIRADRQQTEFLYSNIGRFASMREAICPFFYDIGDGTWHSVNGLGNEIFAYCETFNRLRCREVDGAMIASTILLEQKTAEQATKAQLLTLSNLSILPPGITIASTNIGQGIEATVSVRRDMEQGMNQNIGVLQSAPGAANPRQGQKAKMMELQQKAQLNKGNINRYYTSYDRLHQQIYRRASSPKVSIHTPGGKEALDFQKRCLDRGVPKEALTQIDSVHAMRSIGAGSAVNALMVTEAIMDHAASLPEEGRQLVLRDRISRLAGGKFADRYMGEMNTKKLKTQDDSIAQLENDALRNGGECVITIEQSHIIHLESHIGDCEKHIQEFQDATNQAGQQDINGLQRLFVHLDAAGKHELEHLEQLKDDPIRKDDYQKLFKRWQQLGRIQDQVRQQLEEAMQAQQKEQAAQPQHDPTDFLKLLDYKTAPESVKIQMEQAAQLQRQEGDVSVPEKKLEDAGQKIELKAGDQQHKHAVNDIKLAREVNQV